MQTTIALVRHGETDWNREHRFQGHADVPLNEAGRAQARALARELEGEEFCALYSSPLLRAMETSRIVASTLGVEVERSLALMEVDVGSWSGLTESEVQARFPDGYQRWLEFGHGWDDGETYDDLGRRVVSELVHISERHPGESVLAVTHGGPIRSALAAASGIPFHEARRSVGGLGNCSVTRVAVGNDVVERVG